MKTYECFDLASITRLCPIIKLTGKFSVLVKGSAMVHRQIIHMKIQIAVYGVILGLLACNFRASAGVVAGPIKNPETGNDYYLLTPNTWTASEAEAENLGGTLAIVDDQAEQKWIFSTFGSYGTVADRSLWVGLRRDRAGGNFTWVTGASLTFTNWSDGSPDNAGGNESYAHMWSGATKYPGEWNDAADDVNFYGNRPCGVVEVPQPKALTEKERGLVGTWYEGGRSDRPCYIAATTNMVFAIGKFGRSARVIAASDNRLFAMSWRIRGEIIEDRILWTDGTWWASRASNEGVPESREWFR